MAGEVHTASQWAPRRGLVAGVLLLAGATSGVSSPNAPFEYLDQETGVTVTVVGRPLVFARDYAPFSGGPAPAYGVAARDYVTLAAVAVDRSGKFDYLLIGYFWSVGKLQTENVRLAREPLVIQLRDRRVELVPRDSSARDAGISIPIHQPSVGPATQSVYAVDLTKMELIAESAHPVLYCEHQSSSLKYELFEDRLPALRELVKYLNTAP